MGCLDDPSVGQSSSRRASKKRHQSRRAYIRQVSLHLPPGLESLSSGSFKARLPGFGGACQLELTRIGTVASPNILMLKDGPGQSSSVHSSVNLVSNIDTSSKDYINHKASLWPQISHGSPSTQLQGKVEVGDLAMSPSQCFDTYHISSDHRRVLTQCSYQIQAPNSQARSSPNFQVDIVYSSGGPQARKTER